MNQCESSDRNSRNRSLNCNFGRLRFFDPITTKDFANFFNDKAIIAVRSGGNDEKWNLKAWCSNRYCCGAFAVALSTVEPTWGDLTPLFSEPLDQRPLITLRLYFCRLLSAYLRTRDRQRGEGTIRKWWVTGSNHDFPVNKKQWVTFKWDFFPLLLIPYSMKFLNFH